MQIACDIERNLTKTIHSNLIETNWNMYITKKEVTTILIKDLRQFMKRVFSKIRIAKI